MADDNPYQTMKRPGNIASKAAFVGASTAMGGTTGLALSGTMLGLLHLRNNTMNKKAEELQQSDNQDKLKPFGGHWKDFTTSEKIIAGGSTAALGVSVADSARQIYRIHKGLHENPLLLTRVATHPVGLVALLGTNAYIANKAKKRHIAEMNKQSEELQPSKDGKHNWSPALTAGAADIPVGLAASATGMYAASKLGDKINNGLSKVAPHAEAAANKLGKAMPGKIADKAMALAKALPHSGGGIANAVGGTLLAGGAAFAYTDHLQRKHEKAERLARLGNNDMSKSAEMDKSAYTLSNLVGLGGLGVAGATAAKVAGRKDENGNSNTSGLAGAGIAMGSGVAGFGGAATVGSMIEEKARSKARNIADRMGKWKGEETNTSRLEKAYAKSKKVQALGRGVMDHAGKVGFGVGAAGLAAYIHNKNKQESSDMSKVAETNKYLEKIASMTPEQAINHMDDVYDRKAATEHGIRNAVIGGTVAGGIGALYGGAIGHVVSDNVRYSNGISFRTAEDIARRVKGTRIGAAVGAAALGLPLAGAVLHGKYKTQKAVNTLRGEGLTEREIDSLQNHGEYSGKSAFEKARHQEILTRLANKYHSGN